MTTAVPSLKITEIFLSLQGEAQAVGKPTVFIRLTGCPLRCHYCDSEYAFYGGKRLNLDEILETTKTYGVKHVCVTGGEPLAQPEARTLLSALCEEGYSVSLETSGAMSIQDIDTRVSVVMDLKTPASGEVERNNYDNVDLLASNDQVKFVICDKQDYEWARFKVEELNLTQRVSEVLFSSSYEQLEPTQLAQWIIEDKLPVRFQMQLHKILWGDKPGR